ncbi:hypothetical protein ABZ621_28555 [Streptomyces sp. NPDC007863]|uniref:hypothetical protein n=1 Tax=Streptomyces sp. NPDC007863 TaxID=3154894 RepID=UPI0033C441DB
MTPAPRPPARPAAPAGRAARARRLPALLRGVLLVLAVVAVLAALGAPGPAGQLAGSAAEPRPAGAPAVPDPAGETYEPGSAEAGLPGRTRHRRTRARTAGPAGPPRRRAPRGAAPALVPAPRTSSHRRVVLRC